ncbi:MAG: hypothetical protein K2W84_01035 [Burkholderiales bacterium]|nr:hypothetical protein [Burkholderiales bacterium]
MSKKEMLRGIKAYADALARAGRWGGQSARPVNLKNDYYVYELLCFFKIASEVKSKFIVELSGNYEKKIGGVRGGGGSIEMHALWPMGPANKSNFSFFCLTEKSDQNFIYQLCPGTNVEDMHGKLRAPDISLQKGDAPMNPTFNDVIACWDAKHSIHVGNTLPDTAVSDFAYTVAQFGKPVPPAKWTSLVKLPALRCSGLLTNGEWSTEPDAALAAAGIAETKNFPDEPLTRP